MESTHSVVGWGFPQIQRGHWSPTVPKSGIGNWVPSLAWQKQFLALPSQPQKAPTNFPHNWNGVFLEHLLGANRPWESRSYSFPCLVCRRSRQQGKLRQESHQAPVTVH